MRLDDDVQELELCRERIELVWPAPIVPHDPDVVVADVSLLVHAVFVVGRVGHHCGGMEEDLADIIPPRVSIFSVFVRVQAPSVDIDLPTEIDETPNSFKETGICRGAVGISEDLKLVGLARGDIHNTDFVCVDDGRTVKVSEEGRKGRLVDDSTMCWGTGVRRELKW